MHGLHIQGKYLLKSFHSMRGRLAQILRSLHFFLLFACPWEEDERQFVTADQDWREQRSDSMTAPFKLEPKVTHLYAAAAVYTQHSYPHLAQSLSLCTHTSICSLY